LEVWKSSLYCSSNAKDIKHYLRNCILDTDCPTCQANFNRNMNIAFIGKNGKNNNVFIYYQICPEYNRRKEVLKGEVYLNPNDIAGLDILIINSNYLIIRINCWNFNIKLRYYQSVISCDILIFYITNFGYSQIHSL
jgi:hypothetical protein